MKMKKNYKAANVKRTSIVDVVVGGGRWRNI
jgi:hypothetical protein